MNYEAPRVRDFGTVVEMTAALGVNGAEDGMVKSVIPHHNLLPSNPLVP